MTGGGKGRLRLIDTVFPQDANHHGTLFGGVALAHMDKVAFLAASRHARAPVVTASSEKIDFAAPARIGDIIEASAFVARIGRRSLEVAVELIAEHPTRGEVRVCTTGRITMVVVADAGAPLAQPPPSATADAEEFTPQILRMVDVVFPSQTNHYGTLYGGDALKMMGKAAFIAATRHSRSIMVMAASDRVDFVSPIHEGEMIELGAKVLMVGRSSIRVVVTLEAEQLLTGERRHAATAQFTMVAVDTEGRPTALRS